MPVRVPWDIGVHLLLDYDSESANADESESLETVARYLAALCRRYAETMQLATVNDYLWEQRGSTSGCRGYRRY
jgi:hypothetical protein